jgi:hypothetical protein
MEVSAEVTMQIGLSRRPRASSTIFKSRWRKKAVGTRTSKQFSELLVSYPPKHD